MLREVDEPEKANKSARLFKKSSPERRKPSLESSTSRKTFKRRHSHKKSGSNDDKKQLQSSLKILDATERVEIGLKNQTASNAIDKPEVVPFSLALDRLKSQIATDDDSIDTHRAL